MTTGRPSATAAARAAAAIPIALFTLASGAGAQAAAPPSLVDLESAITPASVRAHIAYLASDARLGRDTPSRGLEEAAAYLAQQHAISGLAPGGENGSFIQRFAYDGTMVPNVVAILPGRDPELRDQVVVMSAHMDHVGIGQPVNGDSIYNGADDNASGTSALVEVARALAALPPESRPRRTVLFLHVSGEEKGLLGSRWWVQNPTIPIERVVANINVDMVGGDAFPDTVAVLGAEYSSLGPVAHGVSAEHPELGLTTSRDLWPEEQLFFRSDQLNFMGEGIPALFYFAGLHECYHRPCDDIDFVSTDKVARVATLLAYTVLEIANDQERPEWDPRGLQEVRRLITGGG
jgi:hypothetical protein